MAKGSKVGTTVEYQSINPDFAPFIDKLGKKISKQRNKKVIRKKNSFFKVILSIRRRIIKDFT